MSKGGEVRMKDNGILPNCVEYARAQEEIERQWKEKHTNGEKKMRMVNLDKMLEQINPFKSNFDKYLYNSVEALGEACKVEAIPVEWIKDWRKAKWFDRRSSMEERMVRAMVARMILEDWEEENETD